MGLAERVAKCRLYYHAYALEVNNVLNQLGLRGDEKAEEVGKKHTMLIMNDCLPRIYGQKAVDEAMEIVREEARKEDAE